MDPVPDSTASSVDPKSRYYSMIATVNILNQARKGKRRIVGSLLPISLSTSTSKSGPSLSRQQSSDSCNTNVPNRVKSLWQQVLPRTSSNRLKPIEGTAIPNVALQGTGTIVNKYQGRADSTAVGLATAEMTLRRRKIRSWRSARKKILYKKFRRVAWLAILVRRVCKMHFIEVSDDADLSFAQVSTNTDRHEIMFDVTQFRAKKQKLLSLEAKRIMRIPAEERTTQELYYVQIALRGLKDIVGYPVNMQKRLARVCWYESYGYNRVIVREGHKPRCFYFIFSGSVVVTVMEPGRLTQRTVAILKRGDSFGELAILNQSTRTSTVTSREDLELLVISTEDFMKIFMSGGVKRLTDSDHIAFIRSIDFLKGWPIELLDLHPKQCVFNFFRRGAVLVRDSKCSDWIYIVKTGSCSVIIKLKKVKSTEKPSKNTIKKEGKRSIGLKHPDLVCHLPPSHHEARIIKKENSFLRNKVRILQKTRPSLFHRGMDLPLVSPAGHDEHSQLDMEITKRESKELRRIIEASGLTLREEEDDQDTGRTEEQEDLCNESDIKDLNVDNNDTEEEPQQAVFGPRRTFADDLNAHSQKVKTTLLEDNDTDVVYICIRLLVKGAAFGLAELMFSDQPSVSLVSNGAECVVLSKHFFLEHAPEHLIHQVRLSVTPYGSVEELQDNFQKELSWKKYRDTTLRETIGKLQTERAILKRPGHSL